MTVALVKKSISSRGFTLNYKITLTDFGTFMLSEINKKPDDSFHVN